jgi:hypothetical protein
LESTPATPLWRRVGVPAAIIVLLGVAIFMLPRGYNTDLNAVGAGKPCVVLVFDKDTVQSQELMNTLNTLRKPYEQRGVVFLVAPLDTADGQRFAQTHGVGGATLMVFDAGGKAIRVLSGRHDADDLKRAIDQAL